MNLPRMNLLYLLAFTDGRRSFRFGILRAIVSLFFLNWIFCTVSLFLRAQELQLKFRFQLFFDRIN